MWPWFRSPLVSRLLLLLPSSTFGWNQYLATYIDVTNFGADPAAARDSAQAFRDAFAAAAVSNRTRTVYVPPGHYKFLSDLRIPQRVTLQGAMASVESFASGPHIRAPFDGSVLEPHHGQGQTAGSFILLNSNAVLSGIIVYYPRQHTGYIGTTSVVNASVVPIPYPWAVAMSGHNAAVLDCYFHNPYQGIGIGVDGQQSWRHHIRNVQGQPIRTGLFIDNVRDIGRVENVHWSYQFFSAALLQYQVNHGRCFVIGRADWQMFVNTFCLGYRVGYHFIATANGASNGNFLGIAADATLIPVMINATNNYGISITNGQFVSMLPSKAILKCCVTDAEPVHVVIGQNTTVPFGSGFMYGRASFSNCNFWGAPRRIIDAQPDLGFVIAVSNSVFRNWKRTEFAVKVTSGSVSITNCEFRTEAPQASIGKDVRRAVISGNLATGSINISVPTELLSAGSAAINGNVGTLGCAGMDLCHTNLETSDSDISKLFAQQALPVHQEYAHAYSTDLRLL